MRAYVTTVTVLAGLLTAAAGVWSLAAPRSFAEFVEFPYHEHFLHDIGAFQLGIGVTLLLALVWSDALATALAGFLVADAVHVTNHVRDLDAGGRVADVWALGAVAVAVAVALALRLRQLGYVVGAVSDATGPAFARFARQKTVLVTTYRTNGAPGSTPVSIAVDGDHAYLRSFEKAVKTRRLQRNPLVEVAPSTARGKATGPAVRAEARLLDGDESRYAAHLLARKHPLLHGLLVPLGHRALRSKTGRTVHFELSPLR
jgi:PPOX class probable F420-dependent enzyme